MSKILPVITTDDYGDELKIGALVGNELQEKFRLDFYANTMKEERGRYGLSDELRIQDLEAFKRATLGIDHTFAYISSCFATRFSILGFLPLDVCPLNGARVSLNGQIILTLPCRFKSK